MTSEIICIIDGCNSPIYVRVPRRQMCRKHYDRQRKYGNPNFRPRPGIDYDNRPRRGVENPNWRGDAVTYGGAHCRVRRTRGRAADQRCSCGIQARHWAYDGTDPEQLYGPSTNGILMFYSADPNRYEPKCSRCHANMDTAPMRALKTWMHQTGTTMPELLRRLGITK